MRPVDRLSKKQKKFCMARKSKENQIKYDMPLKARILMNVVTGLAMLIAPFVWVFTMLVVSVSGLWDAFIKMPLEVRQRILTEFVNKGIAKRRTELTEI
jgi:hypothetical protein